MPSYVIIMACWTYITVQQTHQQQQSTQEVFQNFPWMSRREIDTITHSTLHRDQQFQITTLAEDSSQEGSRKDYYEHRHQHEEALQEDRSSRKSVRSMEEISSPEADKEQHKIENSNVVIIDNAVVEVNGDETEVQAVIKMDTKVSDDSELTNETQLQKKRKKRQQIFRTLNRTGTKKQSLSNQNSQNHQQQNKVKSIMNRVAFQKKRENHTLLKHWNYCRIRNLELHRSVAEQLLKNVDATVKMSLDNLKAYKSFFVQRARQEEIYGNSVFADVDRNIENDETLEQNNHSRGIYIACSSMLQSATRKDKRQKQIALGFANLIQTSILKQIFSQYFDNVHKQSLSLRQKIAHLKTTLQKIDQSICRKLHNLQTNFTECCQDVGRESGKDFYWLELSFLRKCEIQMNLEANYGLCIVEYYCFVMSEEEIRKQLLEKSLRIYGEGLKKYQTDLKQLSNVKAKEEPIKLQQPVKAISISPTEQIKNMYSPQNMLSPEIRQKLSQKLHQSSQKSPQSLIQPSQLNQFLAKCNIEQFSCHHLIMRKFEVQILKGNKWIPGSIVITVDKFVHILINASRGSHGFLYGAQIFTKPETTLRANNVVMLLGGDGGGVEGEIDSDGQLEVVITMKKQQSGLEKLKSLIKSAEKVEEAVRFAKQNDLLQFQDYITDLSD